MAPRRYEMSNRAEAVQQKRADIAAVAIRLFAENTAAATSMEQVAKEAGVSVATAYRHFGDFGALAAACAELAFHIAEIPTPEAAVEQFADIPDLRGRLRRFVEISCECYERAELWLAAERRERHIPAFAATVEREERALDAIVRGLLEPAGADRAAVAVVKTLTEFPFWAGARRNGVPAEAVADLMHDLVVEYLTSTGVPLDGR